MARKTRTASPPSASEESKVDLSIKSLSKQEFAKRLFNLMVAKGWNQSDLARHADIARFSVSNYIRGKTLPSPAVAHKLARALGVKPEELLPNLLENALDAEVPEIEIKAAHGAPGKAWIRLNRLVSMSTAAKIFALIEEDED